jgi:cell division protein FtsW
MDSTTEHPTQSPWSSLKTIIEGQLARPVDRTMLLMVVILSLLGVSAVYSTVAYLADTRLGGDVNSMLIRHLTRLVIAGVVMAVFSVIDYRWLSRYSFPLLVGALLLLCSVWIFGVTTGGATRRLDLVFFGFQPSDLVRITLILRVATLLVKKRSYIKDFGRSFVPILVLSFISAGLIAIEDLSTSMVLVLCIATMGFIGRLSLIPMFSLAAIGMMIAFLVISNSPGRAARVEAFVGKKLFDSTTEEQVFSATEEGYQKRQAHIAIVSGGLLGVGPGKSVGREYVPEPYNDFIFAMIAEEYGVVGITFLLGLFSLLLVRGMLRIARDAPDSLGLILAAGCTVAIVLNAFVHAMVNVGVLPVTGLNLPFISYGGTSLMANGILMGILLNISRHRTRSAPLPGGDDQP